MKKYLIFFAVSILSSCQLDPLTEDASSAFDKIYALSENVEAIDFICKPDQSGYVVLGNFKNSENADLFLIDVSADGMQKQLQRISTPNFDEGKRIIMHPEGDALLVLGQRRENGEQTPITDNFVIKTDLNGNPVRAKNINEKDSVNAELKFLPNNDAAVNFRFNDIAAINSNLILAGQITRKSTNNSNKITQIYDLNSFNFADTSDLQIELQHQKPTVLKFDNSESLKLMTGDNTGQGYSLIGQVYNENPLEEIAGASKNISWDFYPTISSSPSAMLYVGSDENETFDATLAHSNGKTYFGGHYEDKQSALFLITKEFKGVDTNSEQNIYNLSDYGTMINSLTEDSSGNIIMATRDEGEIDDLTYLLKFSQSGVLIENENFRLLSTGSYTIKKIEGEPNSNIVILSQKTFENNSTAIGLMKIKF